MLSNIKKILYPAVLLIFFAFTFQSNPPGWYQQTLPRTDVIITDIFFTDSLKGWATARKYPSEDSAFIFHTFNGGDNWSIQYKNKYYLTTIKFIDSNIGYSVGSAPPGVVLKTTNGGINWFNISSPDTYPIDDIHFVSKDTGWAVANNPLTGGVFRTTNGGNNWTIQLNQTYRPESIFFLNKDTGWATSSEASSRLYRTTNSGINWNVQYFFTNQTNDVYFINSLTGIITGGINRRTTDGGFNWVQTNNAGYKISMVNDSIGWAGVNFNIIAKTTNGGISWGYQNTPTFDCSSVCAIDTGRVWAAGQGIIHTTDGGGPIMDVKQIGTEIPTDYQLLQNYPNPFNPTTKISFSIKRQTSNVKLQIFDVSGKLIEILINKSLPAGAYEIDFNAKALSSGAYFYKLTTNDFSQTKKMLLLK